MMNPILIGAAVTPAVFLMIKVYKSDKLEKEPVGYLIKLALYGVFSTAIALYGERIGTHILNLLFDENTLIYRLIMYFGIVAFTEEGAKYFLLKKKTWKSRDFNCQFDGVVYAVFISLGFALWENIEYVAMYGLSTAMIRAVTAVPGHACFGVFMGVFYGAAKRFEVSGDPVSSKLYRRLSVLIPAFMHGIYDFIATSESTLLGLGFFGFAAIMFVISYRLVKTASALDRYIMHDENAFPDK